FFSTNFSSYKLENLRNVSSGYEGFLIRQGNSPWPDNIEMLKFNVWFHSRTIVHFKMIDPVIKRYEVPIEIPAPPSDAPGYRDYQVFFNYEPFGIRITRYGSRETLFNSIISSAPLIYADQFLQISTLLQSKYLFGLGEGSPYASGGRRYTYWARDQTSINNSTLKGEHPFYINVDEYSKNAHGVLFLNSNAMDVNVYPTPAATFRSIGGVLDFYIFTGPSLEDVVQQYIQLIGIPTMPPFWALGFHLSNSNYKDIQNLRRTIKRNRDIGIPYDVQWSDVDYMERWKIWTYDKYLYKDLPQLVAELHENFMKYIITLHPGVSNRLSDKYPPYDRGIQQGVFIRNFIHGTLEGSLKPGPVVYPDFAHPNAAGWWLKEAEDFRQVVQFDGLCLDMNEPSNSVDGSTTGCTNNKLDRPPYVPDTAGNGKLEYKTLCSSALQFHSHHYNLHNLYGLHMTMASRKAQDQTTGKRTLSISRSTYPSHGKYGQQWSAGWKSSWEDMRYSITSLLNSQMFGIPFVGVDVCGFNGDSSEELCTRWTQLGAFYPFMRNHNNGNNKASNPGAWHPSIQRLMKEAIELRYSLLPFMYTQFYLNHVDGRPVIRPLSFVFPDDSMTYDNKEQFLWGTSLLVSPILQPASSNQDSKGYFPDGLWYDLFTHAKKESHGEFYKLNSSLCAINLHVRGGSVLTRQKPAVTTAKSRKNPINLLVALNEDQTASGELFCDDGETL
ncbi:hypothetical protein HELRODRAFT_119637, partial [Helobdella robusta]|uniref:Glycoside hydrolase family 31 N-terminal domain-containing protein n=1 Tax=Helobdella robusta TaxID=6412 RepID=T1EGN4_HELRO